MVAAMFREKFRVRGSQVKRQRERVRGVREEGEMEELSLITCPSLMRRNPHPQKLLIPQASSPAAGCGKCYFSGVSFP